MPKLFCCKHILIRRIISGVILLTFLVGQILTPSVLDAQVLPTFGQTIGLTPLFQPPVLRGMTVHPENPLLFDFIVDRGQDKIGNELLKDESTKLIKYFLTSMTIPDKDAWVNLSPTEKDRIIPDALGQTEMGKVMLEQDYVLKQLAASLTNPDTDLGKRYWDEVNKRNVTVGNGRDRSLQNKVWIVPDGATVVEKDGFAYITESKLTVMLDEDYGAQNLSSPHALSGDPLPKIDSRFRGNDIEKLSTKVFRQLILPKLIEEVNAGKNFAATRQVYQSVILAAWYKRALKDSLLGRIYADKSKVAGVETDVKDIKQKVYEQYLEAFKKGAYNVIKEENGPDGDLIPRKYFSGGQIMASAPIVVSSPTAVNGVRQEINQSERVGRIALVAASTVEAVLGQSNFISVDLENGWRLKYKGTFMGGVSFFVPIVKRLIAQELVADPPRDIIVEEKKDLPEIYSVSLADSPEYIIKVRMDDSLRVEEHTKILKLLNIQKGNPHIVKLLFYGEHYLVMNYLPGESLSDKVRNKGILPVKKTVDIAVNLAQAVKFVHSRGVAAYDVLSLWNIQLTDDNFVYLYDFDLAYISRPYMSDKIFEFVNIDSDEVVDELSDLKLGDNDARVLDDIFAMGHAIYFALTGKDLVLTLTNEGVLLGVDNDEIRHIIRRAVASYPALGENVPYKNVDELLADLEALQKKLNTSSAVDVVKDVSTSTVENKSTVGGLDRKVGGIDFDPSKLNLQIKRDGKGVPLPLPQQDLENINIRGLYPVILNILPVNVQTLPILGQFQTSPDVVLSKG